MHINLLLDSTKSRGQMPPSLPPPNRYINCPALASAVLFPNQQVKVFIYRGGRGPGIPLRPSHFIFHPQLHDNHRVFGGLLAYLEQFQASLLVPPSSHSLVIMSTYGTLVLCAVCHACQHIYCAPCTPPLNLV